MIKTFFFAVISIALYTLLLFKQSLILDYVTRGGSYTILPIITAFVFSFVHGNFTGGFWSLFGIEAKKERR
jgi:hypothetical protein